jgi:hypothetical protein
MKPDAQKFVEGDGVVITGTDEVGIIVGTFWNEQYCWWDCYIGVTGYLRRDGSYKEMARWGASHDHWTLRYLDSSLRSFQCP